MKVLDNQINRAQIYAPFTEKATIDKADMNKFTKSFVYIVNTKDEVVFDLPVSTMYMKTVKEEIEKRGDKHLTSYEKKALLLKVSRENRSYDLKSVLGEEEWDY